MQVAEHVVSFYVATCGQNGPGLGSDEKEIILLVYVILEATTGQIIGTKQILVRPDGTFIKDRTTSTSSDTSNTAASSPPLAITSYADSINNSSCSSNNLNSTNNSIISLNITTNSSTPTSPTTNNNCHNISTSSLTAASIINNNNTIVNNNNITNGLGSLAPVDNIELPIAVAQAAGKPLQEAIEEFDDYLRSLSLYDTDFKIITFGQLPLRQCLHREACVKDIGLPSYYNKFSDLRKEFSIYKTGDLSRALVPVKDIKKILQLPAITLPQSIGEIMKELNITSVDDNEFYIRESRDMVSVIQHLIKAGHKFTANETISLVLEPGICSIDDEIEGNCIVRARGLPWQSSDQDIAKFFRGLNVAKGGVALCLSPLGRRNGEALIRFISQEHRDMALKRHKHHIGNRYIEVYRATSDDFLSVAGGASNEAQAFLSKGAQVIIRMRGLPYDCTAKQVLDFFTNGENPCNVLDNTEGVLFVKKPDGRATGDAFVLFANESDAPKALARHRESIGQRYIELFRSTTAEVQQVLNRSLDPKTYEPNHQPPLIAQLPPMQLSLLPQHLITSGTTKNCIRLRGLPYEALVEHILHFLDDFAKHIIFQGVHMVINAQGQPSGEAFIQMDSEESARLCAQRKHHQFMVFGKKYRYIEVFQCSGDDMNMVLNGGLQSPVPTAAHAHPHLGGGKQPSLLSPGMLAQQPPANAQTISPHTHAHTHAHAHTLQSPPSMAAAVAALSQPPQLAMPATAQPVAVATAGISPYMTTAAPPSTVPHPSLAQNAAAVAQNAAAAAAVGNLATPSTQLSVHTASSSAVSPQAAMTFPFNLSLPPPQTTATAAANSALIAQQQAQFIAQHNLLARQQAAAAAVTAAEHHQMYTNVNHLFMQQQNAAAAAAAAAMGQANAAAAGQPQFLFMPRPYFQPFPLGYLPAQQGYQFAGVVPQPAAAATNIAGTAASGMHAAAAAAAVNAANVAAAATMPHSMKRSYENAFQHEANAAAASAAKRVLTRPPGSFYQFYNPGASVIGPPFGHFGPFAPPGPILGSPHRATAHHPHATSHGPPPPHPAAFYPHPLVYWPYPSPPVSPTTYFNQPTHSPTHVPGNHGPPMYSLDYISAVQPTNYANPATPLSPPAPPVGVPANAGGGLILSPNKAPAMAMLPQPKQYPPVAAAVASNIASITPAYTNKMALPLPQPPPPPRAATNNLYHHYNSPTTLTPATVSTTHPTQATGAVVKQTSSSSSGILKTPPKNQPLLAIETTTTNRHTEQPIAVSKTNTTKQTLNAAVVKTSKDATDNVATTSTNLTTPTTTNGIPAIVTNHCVELYTS